ncbi:hypothetical protein NPIL_118881 [Nephila pilipes]|uniref:Uncharacterized protein n=1 Tax=Nephila pilipes TaxID=299642 RepID=A0A8X6IDA5_NEPPI|nr:hypothetical protein NPIL_118881 [Nephila pilipes]
MRVYADRDRFSEWRVAERRRDIECRRQRQDGEFSSPRERRAVISGTAAAAIKKTNRDIKVLISLHLFSSVPKGSNRSIDKGDKLRETGDIYIKQLKTFVRNNEVYYCLNGSEVLHNRVARCEN